MVVLPAAACRTAARAPARRRQRPAEASASGLRRRRRQMRRRRREAGGAAEVARDLEAVGAERHAELVPEVVQVLDHAPVDRAPAGGASSAVTY